MMAIEIRASGMMTSVGLGAPASCAAIRCAIDRFEETRFLDRGGEWLVGASVPLDEPARGREKLLRLATRAIRECLDSADVAKTEAMPLLLCLAEEDRPGRLEGLDDSFLAELSQRVGTRFHRTSRVFSDGRVAGALALEQARAYLERGCPGVLIGGVDGFLVAPTLAAYEARRRLLTSQHSDGFIPGEGAAAVLVGPPGQGKEGALLCRGIGVAEERATVESEEPLKGDGLAQALTRALADAGFSFTDVDYRLAGVSGEQYFFKEAALALARAVRVPKQAFPIWHPADCVGEIGAAIVPCVLAVALAAARKGYAPGRGVLCHFSADDARRAAFVLRHEVDGDG